MCVFFGGVQFRWRVYTHAPWGARCACGWANAIELAATHCSVDGLSHVIGWVALAWARAFELTGEAAYLARAEVFWAQVSAPAAH